MFEPIKMNNEVQLEKLSNQEILEALNQIKQNTNVTKGWMTFLGTLTIVTLVVYLFISIIGVNAILDLLSGILG